MSIHEKTTHTGETKKTTRRFFFRFGTVALGIGLLLVIPFIPERVERTISMVIAEFGTEDKWLSDNQYALTAEGDGYWIRDKNVGPTGPRDYYLPKLDIVPLEYDLSDMEEVKIVGDRVVDVFITPGAKVEVIEGTYEEYWNTSNIPFYSPPSKLYLSNLYTKLKVPRSLVAAIAYDARTGSGRQSTVSSYNFSHTTSGSDRGLLVGVASTDNTISDANATNVTYNAVGMTEEVEVSDGTDARSDASIWSLADPASGSNTVEVTLNNTTLGSFALAISFTGVNQSDPGGDVATSTTLNTNAPSLVATTTENNSWVFDIAAYRSGTASGTPGSGQTEVSDDLVAPGGAAVLTLMSHEGPQVTPGEVTMSWTTTDSTDDFVHAVLELKPEPSPTTLTQSAYKWGTNPGSALASQDLSSLNTPIIAPAQGTGFRLRIVLDVDGGNLVQSSTTTDLQVAERSGTCDTAFSGESYSDVAVGSGDIRFFDNSIVADGQGTVLVSNDPRSGSNPLVAQDYEEQNGISNTEAAINVGESGIWDISLVDNSAPPGTSYCFRLVQDGGGVLDGYTVIPEITTAQEIGARLRGIVRLRVIRLF